MKQTKKFLSKSVNNILSQFEIDHSIVKRSTTQKFISILILTNKIHRSFNWTTINAVEIKIKIKTKKPVEKVGLKKNTRDQAPKK